MNKSLAFDMKSTALPFPGFEAINITRYPAFGKHWRNW